MDSLPFEVFENRPNVKGHFILQEILLWMMKSEYHFLKKWITLLA